MSLGVRPHLPTRQLRIWKYIALANLVDREYLGPHWLHRAAGEKLEGSVGRRRTVHPWEPRMVSSRCRAMCAAMPAHIR